MTVSGTARVSAANRFARLPRIDAPPRAPALAEQAQGSAADAAALTAMPGAALLEPGDAAGAGAVPEQAHAKRPADAGAADCCAFAQTNVVGTARQGLLASSGRSFPRRPESEGLLARFPL